MQSFPRLLEAVASAYGVTPEQILSRDKRIKPSAARAVVAYLAYRSLGMRLAAIDRALRVSNGSARKMIERVKWAERVEPSLWRVVLTYLRG